MSNSEEVTAASEGPGCQWKVEEPDAHPSELPTRRDLHKMVEKWGRGAGAVLNLKPIPTPPLSGETKAAQSFSVSSTFWNECQLSL